MSMFPKKKLSVSAGFGVLIVLGISACSTQPTTYSGLSDLLDAYNTGVKVCESPDPFLPLVADYGIDGVTCASGDAVVWFQDDDAEAQWLDLVTGAGETYVLGPNWMVMTSDFESVTRSMGGTPSE